MDVSHRFSIQKFTIIYLIISDITTNSMVQIRRYINASKVFTEINDCIDYITDLKTNNVLMIINYTLENEIISWIADLSQIDSIFLIKSQEACQHPQSTLTSTKIEGIFDNIESFCEFIDYIFDDGMILLYQIVVSRSWIY